MARRHHRNRQLLLLATASYRCQSASAIEAAPFEIGAMLGPPSLPTDHNTPRSWQRIRDCGIDTMFGVEDGSGHTKAVNQSAIANAHHQWSELACDAFRARVGCPTAFSSQRSRSSRAEDSFSGERRSFLLK